MYSSVHYSIGTKMFNYNSSFKNQINQIQKEGRYRDFIGLQRHAGDFPLASWGKDRKKITMWCQKTFKSSFNSPLNYFLLQLLVS